MPRPDQLSLPTAYLRQILELARARGVGAEAVLQGLDIDAALLDTPDARVSLAQAAGLFGRALKLTGDPALGYEIGLGSQLTTHGFVGYGLMAFPTFRQALDFGRRFVSLRTPFVALDYRVDGDTCLLEVTEAMPLGPLRQCVFELFLSGIWRMLPQLAEDRVAHDPRIVICFDFPPPAHFAAYRERLPPCEFDGPVNGLRFPAAYLDLPMPTADRTTAELVTRQCEQELTAIGGAPAALSTRVRAMLEDAGQGFPQQAELARRLHLSERSLKRKLQREGTSYQRLLDAARERAARRHLSAGRLGIGEIACLLGYTNPANFTRAFRKWTGQTPRDYRAGGRLG